MAVGVGNQVPVGVKIGVLVTTGNVAVGVLVTTGGVVVFVGVRVNVGVSVSVLVAVLVGVLVGVKVGVAVAHRFPFAVVLPITPLSELQRMYQVSPPL